MIHQITFPIANDFFTSYISDVNPSEEKKWADVIFTHPPLQRFTYIVPNKFRDELCLGHRVLVPLGNRKMTGFIVDFIDQPEIEDLREIEDILDPYPLLTPELLKLTRWVAEYYMAHWGEVIRAALPPGIHRRARVIVQSIEKSVPANESLSELENTILSVIRKKGKISQQSLERQLDIKRIRFPLMKLEKRGLIRMEHVLEEARVHAQSEIWISLRKGIDPEDIRNQTKRAPRQAEVLKILKKYGGEVRRGDLDVDFSILRILQTKGWIEMWEEEVFRDTYQGLKVETPKPLNLMEEQRKALSQIEKELKKNTFHTFLLHGVTSSGKTQVYIEAIRRVLSEGKTALVLIPEISLTPQAIQRYRGNFGNEVAVLHSRMSPGERYDSWRKIREGKFRIALGPRSAVFAPLDNLRLIVVDEEHDTSYKQIDPSPRYHARDVAVVRAKMNDCTIILGSATPSLESYSNSIEGKYSICKLSQRIDGIPLPRVTLVNHNEVRKGQENRVFSPILREKMKDRLEKGEQIILLQNRRGYATFLRCKACGTIEGCPHCDITLTYHQKGHLLRCHYCGFQKPASDVCPSCNGATLHYRGVGTQRVEEEVSRLFPQARLFRMDQDTTRRKGAHHRIVIGFEKGKRDVLLGTQMVAKGHDFPGVSLVGIISADTGLHFPDFRSGEKTFQLLTQAAGRAGRRNLRGEVIIQTLSPNNPVLQFAAEQDYSKFYRREIEQRRELAYPPWGRIVLIRFKGGNEKRTARAAQVFAEQVVPDDSFELLGPASAPISKAKKMYRYQIIFRANKNQDPAGKNLRKTVRRVLSVFHEKTRFHDIRVGVDVDPVDML